MDQSWPTLYSLSQNNWIAITPDGLLPSSRNIWAIWLSSFGRDSYPFEQFDVELNRPDIVVERLGASPDTVAAFHRAYEKRLSFVHADKEGINDSLDVPSVQLTTRVPISSHQRVLEFGIRAVDSHSIWTT